MGQAFDSPGSLLTEDYLDRRLAALEKKLIREVTRLAVLITLAAVAGVALSAGIAAILT